jgi:transposase
VKFFHARGGNAVSNTQRRVNAINAAIPLTQDNSVIMPDASLFTSLQGTGPCLAPRLLAALGEDRARFNSAQEIQNYAGLSPVTELSGQKNWVHWRWQCSKFVRQSFIEWSAKSVHQSYWAGLYCAQQRAKGKSHQSAVRALAYKWVRIVYKCWKTRTP